MFRVPLVNVDVKREFEFTFGLEVSETQSRYNRDLFKVLIFLKYSCIQYSYIQIGKQNQYFFDLPRLFLSTTTFFSLLLL